MTKNEFVFACITGLPIAGQAAGAENDGWRDRPSYDEASGYHDAITAGDLGDQVRDDLESCEGDFEAEAVARLIDNAK